MEGIIPVGWDQPATKIPRRFSVAIDRPAFGSTPIQTGTYRWLRAPVIVAQDGSGDFNGTTQDCIQQAVDSLTTLGGGWVFLLPGTYVISTPISVTTPYVTIEGVYGATILSVLSDINVINATADYVTLKNILIVGDYLGGGTSSAIYIDSVYAEIDVCEVYGVRGNGIHYKNTYGGIIQISTTNDCGLDGIRLDGSTYNIVSNHISDGNAGCGANLINSPTNNISGSLFARCNVGIQCDTGSSTVWFGTSATSENATFGMDLAGDYYQILGNYSFDNLSGGIRISGNNNTITSNKIGVVSLSQAVGILEIGTADFNTIVANTLFGNTTNMTLTGPNDEVGHNKET